MKEALRKSKANGEPFKEALRGRTVEALACGPLETVGEFFTIPTTTLDASVHPDATNEYLLADDTVARSVAHDTSS